MVSNNYGKDTISVGISAPKKKFYPPPLKLFTDTLPGPSAPPPLPWYVSDVYPSPFWYVSDFPFWSRKYRERPLKRAPDTALRLTHVRKRKLAVPPFQLYRLKRSTTTTSAIVSGNFGCHIKSTSSLFNCGKQQHDNTSAMKMLYDCETFFHLPKGPSRTKIVRRVNSVRGVNSLQR